MKPFHQLTEKTLMKRFETVVILRVLWASLSPGLWWHLKPRTVYGEVAFMHTLKHVPPDKPHRSSPAGPRPPDGRMKDPGSNRLWTQMPTEEEGGEGGGG